MSNPEMPFLSSIGLSVTTRCPLACAHCIVKASPHRAEEMSLEEACNWMRQAASYRQGHIKAVVITGGEPFENLTRLQAVLECAEQCGLVAAVVTNAFWAETVSRAFEVLNRLPYLHMLTISTDAYHQRFLPLSFVKNGIVAARKRGLKFNIAICFDSEESPAYLELRGKLEKLVGKELIYTAAVFAAGRARRKSLASRLPVTTKPPEFFCTAADFPTIFPNGQIIGCMGIVEDLPRDHPLYLGNLRERSLADILDEAENNVALHILRLWGPRTLISLLAEAGLSERLPPEYSKYSCCDLCYALRADAKLLAGLREALQNDELAVKTAYARVYYLQEKTMLRGVKEETLQNLNLNLT